MTSQLIQRWGRASVIESSAVWAIYRVQMNATLGVVQPRNNTSRRSEDLFKRKPCHPRKKPCECLLVPIVKNRFRRHSLKRILHDLDRHGFKHEEFGHSIDQGGRVEECSTQLREVKGSQFVFLVASPKDIS